MKNWTFEEKLEAFKVYCTQSGSIPRVSDILNIDRRVLKKWKNDKEPDGKTDWDKGLEQYNKDNFLNREETKKLSEQELAQIRRLSKVNKFTDANFNNFTLVMNSLSKNLMSKFKSKTLEDISTKELKDYVTIIEKMTKTIDTLYLNSMPAPTGYISLEDMNNILGRTAHHLLGKISNHKEIELSTRNAIIKEFLDYIKREDDNLNKRNDLQIITIEQGKELIRRQSEETEEVEE